MAKLVIKLKVVANEAGNATQSINPHTCHVCNKIFTCGKAYGGHKRIHSMKKKQKKPIDEKINNIESCDPIIPRRPSNYTRCFCCPKTFRTEKSFLEHIQSHFWAASCEDDEDLHPELERNDPNSSSALDHNALEQESYDQINSGNGEKTTHSDLVKALPFSWSKTGKRGQNAELHHIPVPISSVDKHQENDSMFSTLEESRKGMLPLKKRKLVSPSSASPYPQENQSLDHYAKTDEVDHEGKESTPMLAKIDGDCSNMKEQSNSFVCQVWENSFVCCNALEGGNAHHNRDGENGDYVQGSGRGRYRHRCTNCNRCFERIQALLCHTRHCNRQKEEITSKRAFAFDLNEFPPPESED